MKKFVLCLIKVHFPPAAEKGMGRWSGFGWKVVGVWVEGGVGLWWKVVWVCGGRWYGFVVGGGWDVVVGGLACGTS